MKDLDKIIENVDADDIDFGEPINSETVKKLETGLNVQLPDSFKNFLAKYGWLEVLGTEYLGFYGDNIEDPTTFIGYTLEQRKNGLSKEFIIFQNNEDFGLACLDISKTMDNECPVIIWDRWNKTILEETSMNFEEFVVDNIKNMLEYN